MEVTDWKEATVMRKTSFHGSKLRQKDDGSILGFTVVLLLCVVVAVGIMLRASYAEFMKVRAEYESFVASIEHFAEEREDEIH